MSDYYYNRFSGEACEGSAYFTVTQLEVEDPVILEGTNYKVWVYRGFIHNVLENPDGAEHYIEYMLIPYWMANVPMPMVNPMRLRVDLYDPIPDQKGVTDEKGDPIMRKACVLADYWMFNGGIMPPPEPTEA